MSYSTYQTVPNQAELRVSIYYILHKIIFGWIIYFVDLIKIPFNTEEG